MLYIELTVTLFGDILNTYGNAYATASLYTLDTELLVNIAACANIRLCGFLHVCMQRTQRSSCIRPVGTTSPLNFHYYVCTYNLHAMCICTS